MVTHVAFMFHPSCRLEENCGRILGRLLMETTNVVCALLYFEHSGENSFGNNSFEWYAFLESLQQMSPSIKSIVIYRNIPHPTKLVEYVSRRAKTGHLSVDFHSCYLCKRGVEPIIHFMKMDILDLGFVGVSFEDPIDKLRIAKALETSKSLRKFHLGVEMVNGSYKALCDALTRNEYLIQVRFEGCCDMAMSCITDAVENSLSLRHAFITGKVGGGEALQQACQRRANHATELNKMGRRQLQECGNLEDFWVSQLIANSETHALVFCWIRDYPHLFVRAADLGGGTK